MTELEKYESWALEIMPYIQYCMDTLSEGIGDDIPKLLQRQQEYSGMQGRMIEIYANANAYLVTAKAVSTEKYIKLGTPPSLVKSLSDGDMQHVIRFYEMVHRLNTTLSDLSMAISSRMKFESALRFENRGNPR